MPILALSLCNRGKPAGTGTLLANTVLEYLSLQRVCEINLGTQTAEPFYITT